jgi:hypothetical protein
MTVNQMFDLLTDATKQRDQGKLLRALRQAHRWTALRIYNAANGPELLATIGEEYAINVTTKTIDLAAIVLGGQFLSCKMLWLKFTNDAKFTPMVPANTDDEEFRALDTDLAASPTIAAGHPVLFAIENFSQARFAPALPASSTVRLDYYRIPPEPGAAEAGETSLSEEDEDWEVAVDLPAIFHDGMVERAKGFLWHNLDDDRENLAIKSAIDEITEAIYMSKRTKGPTTTRPFRQRRRRWI